MSNIIFVTLVYIFILAENPPQRFKQIEDDDEASELLTIATANLKSFFLSSF